MTNKCWVKNIRNLSFIYVSQLNITRCLINQSAQESEQRAKNLDKIAANIIAPFGTENRFSVYFTRSTNIFRYCPGQLCLAIRTFSILILGYCICSWWTLTFSSYFNIFLREYRGPIFAIKLGTKISSIFFVGF